MFSILFATPKDIQPRLRQICSSLQQPTAEGQPGIVFASVGTPATPQLHLNSAKVDTMWDKENQSILLDESRATAGSFACRSVRPEGIHTSTPLRSIQISKGSCQSRLYDSGLSSFSGHSSQTDPRDKLREPLRPYTFAHPSNAPLNTQNRHCDESAYTTHFPISCSPSSAFTPVRQKQTDPEYLWRPYLDWRLDFCHYFVLSYLLPKSLVRGTFYSPRDSFSHQMCIYILINIFRNFDTRSFFFGSIVIGGSSRGRFDMSSAHLVRGGEHVILARSSIVLRIGSY